MNDRATKHAEDVVSGKVQSGEFHKLACKRHLHDLERQGTSEFPYYWNEKKSEDILNFAGLLTIAEGTKPKPVILFDNQCFDLGVPMGWIKLNGNRRFRRSYESMARQNGKSFKNGIRGPYIAYASGYNYGKLFTAATKKRQAKIAWEEMAKFIRSDPELLELFKIQDYLSLITCLDTKCTIEALSKEGGLDDGFRSIFTSLDELHQMKDNKVYKALYNGTKALPETLVSMITTRGANIKTFCFEIDKYCQSILYGNETAEDFFVDIYTIDKNDSPFDENIWHKANPVLLHPDNPGYDHNFETFLSDANTARAMGGSELADFMVKSLNVWYRDRSTEFVPHDKWQMCGIDMTFEQLRGSVVNIGLDLSSGGDLTSWTAETEIKPGEYFIDGHSYMPRGRFEEHIETDTAPYDVWEQQELLTVTGGQTDFKNDYGFIISELREFINRYDLKINCIAYDPHNADGILGELERFGAPLIAVTQSARNLNDATCDIQYLVKSGKYHYNKRNELLSHSFLNAVTVKNSFDEIKIDKEPGRKTARIDPVDAAIDAHYGSIKGNKKRTDVNDELKRYLEIMTRK